MGASLPGLDIRPERQEDRADVARLLRNAFEGPLEARLVDRLRRQDEIVVALAARLEDQLVGHVAFSHAVLEHRTGAVPIVWLAPLAVAEPHWRRGIGSRLTESGLAACRARGYRHAIVLGDPAYYWRFGFRHGAALGLQSRWQCDALMLARLDESAGLVFGTLGEPSAFAILN